MKVQMDIINEKQIDYFARAFSKLLTPPKIVLLTGDLGAGKTTLVKSLAKYLGSNDVVTSPTFTLLNIYEGKFPIYHFDMYRLASAEEASAVGFDEYFDKSKLDGVVFVEWPENVAGLIKDFDFVVKIEKVTERRRKIILTEGENASCN